MADENKEQNLQNNILYIGGDKSFFDNLQISLKKMATTIDFHFTTWFSEDSKVIQSYILKIKELKPRVIILDHSMQEESILHLGRVLIRENKLQNLSILSVCDLNQGKKSIFKAINSKIPSVHIKGLEFEAIVYAILNLAYPDKVENHGFVTASLNELLNIFHPGKINIVNENFIKFESDNPLDLNTAIRCKNFWHNRKIVGSDLGQCIKSETKNIYYNFKYTQIVQLAHAEAIVRTSTMTDDDYNYRQQKRIQDVKQSQANLGTWVIENKKFSRPKLVRVLSIDKTYSIFDLQEQTDQYPFQLKNEPFLENTRAELLKYNPKIILFNLEYIDQETIESNNDIAFSYNDSRKLQHLIKTAKQIFPQNPPIIICFNSKEHDTNYYQKTFSFSNIMAVSEEMHSSMALKLVNNFYNKIIANMAPAKESDIYLPKTSDISYIEIEDEITIKGCSENDIYFNSTKNLEIGQIFRVNLPIPMYITVVKNPEWTIVKSQYYGIIHGIGSKERQALRRFINSVFFRELDLAKTKDEEEVEKLKEAYIKKQQDEIEKARLEKEAKKKQADEKAANDAMNIANNLE